MVQSFPWLLDKNVVVAEFLSNWDRTMGKSIIAWEGQPWEIRLDVDTLHNAFHVLVSQVPICSKIKLIE